ncbi:unnamed protein product [Scytosiphon promiscuus]
MRSKSHLGRDGGPDRGEGCGGKSFHTQVDRLLLRLQPTPLADERRRAVFEHVQEVVQLQVPDCKIFPVGSFPLKTYLPYADVDMVMFLPGRSMSTSRSEGPVGKVGAASAWNGGGLNHEAGSDDDKTPGAARITPLVTANQALCIAAARTKRSSSGRNPHRRPSVQTAKPEIRSVSFINARTPIVKMVVGNMVVDLTENQGGSVAAAALLEEADNLIQRDHLFKRSLLLLKAWAWCETPRLVGKRVLGAQEGGLTSYGLSVMVLHLFAAKSSADTLVHPLDVLLRFFEVYSGFDWDRYCLTLDGPVPVDSVCEPLPHGSFQSEIDPSSRLQLLVKKVLAELRSSRHARSSDGHGEDSSFAHSGGVAPSVPPPAPHFPKRPCNILDPLNALNNLGHSVVKPNLEALERALQQGREKLECWQLLSPASPARLSRRASRQRRQREADAVRPRQSQGGHSACTADARDSRRSGAGGTSTARAGAETGGHRTDYAPPFASSLGQHLTATPQGPHHFTPPAQFMILPPLHPAHQNPALNGPSQPVLVPSAYPLTTREGQPIVLAFPQPLLQAVPHQHHHVNQPQPYMVQQGHQGFLRPHSALLVPAAGPRAHAEFWPQPHLRSVAYQGDNQLGPDQPWFAPGGRNLPQMGWSGPVVAHSEMHGVMPEAEAGHKSASRSEEVKGSPIEHEHRGTRRRSFEEYHDRSSQRSMLPWDLPAFVNASPTSSTASLSDFMEDGSKDGQDGQVQDESGAEDDEVHGRPVKESLLGSPFHGSDHGDAMVDTRQEERDGPDDVRTKWSNGNLWTSWFLRDFFPECCHRYGSGDGFREDLLDHPCQRSTKLQEPGSPLPRRNGTPDVLQGASRPAWDSLRMVGEMLREVGPEQNGHHLVKVAADAEPEIEPSPTNDRVDREKDGDEQVDGGSGAWSVRASNMAEAERQIAQGRREDAVAPCDIGGLSLQVKSSSEAHGADVLSRKRFLGGLDGGDGPQCGHGESPTAFSVRVSPCVCVDDETGYTTSEEQGDREDAMPLTSPAMPQNSRSGKSRGEGRTPLLPAGTLSRAESFPASTLTQALGSASTDRRGFGVGMHGAAPELVEQGIQCFIPAPKKMVSTASQLGGPGRISISTGVQCDILMAGESRDTQCRSDTTKHTSIGVQCSLPVENGETETRTEASMAAVAAVRGEGSVTSDFSGDKRGRTGDPGEELPRVTRPSSRPSETADSASAEILVGSYVNVGVEDTVGVPKSKKKRKKGKAMGVAARSTASAGVAGRSPIALLKTTAGVGDGVWTHLLWRGVCFCGLVGLLLVSVWGARGRAAETSLGGTDLLATHIAHEDREGAAQPPVWVMVGGSLTLGEMLASRRPPSKEKGAGGVQWYKGDRLLPGQTRPFLTISEVSLEDEGTYACFAVDDSGRKRSRALWEETTVRISEAPLVESQLQTQRLARGEMLAIVATASGVPQPEYQWRRNGLPIPGANRPMFVRHSVSEADMGTYTCDVYNIAGSVQWEEMAVVLQETGRGAFAVR